VTVRRGVLAVAFGLFVAGFWAAVAYVRHASPGRLEQEPRFGLFVVLLGALAGFALAAVVLFADRLVELLRLAAVVPRRAVWAWAAVALVVVATVLVSLFVLNRDGGGSLDAQLTRTTRPITVLAAICLLPGLATFLALRWLGLTEANWAGPGADRIRLLLRLRAEHRRLLGSFGAFLTLLVVAAGLRRRALLAVEPRLPLPPEAVLVYGLVFAVLLGLFHLAAASALDHRAALLLEEYVPVPDPADEEVADRLSRRTELGALMGVGGAWQSFQTTVVIAAPLLTGLVGVATS
jgi:uncharacterized membrane protein YidH (DUF202 family)